MQDLADRFGVSTSLVSRICITWINLLYFELKDLFPFPSQELVRKNMPDEFAKFATTRIILDCTEIFIQRPSAVLAQSETCQAPQYLEATGGSHSKWPSHLSFRPLGWVGVR